MVCFLLFTFIFLLNNRIGNTIDIMSRVEENTEIPSITYVQSFGGKLFFGSASSAYLTFSPNQFK